MLRHRFFDDPKPWCYADADPPPAPAGGASDPPPADPQASGETPPAPAAGAAATPPVTPPTPEPPVEDWRDKQLARQTRREREKDARLAEVASENERLKQLLEAKQRVDGGTPPPSPPPASPPAQRPAAAPPQGDDPVAVARFQLEMEQVEQKLNAEYRDDWNTARERLAQMGGIPPPVMQAIFATDDPAYVLVQLGKKPERFQEILDLPPAKQATALVKMGMEKAAAAAAVAARPLPKPSDAPPPVEHLRPGGGTAQAGHVDLYDPKIKTQDYDAAWYAERERQKRESKGRPWSINR